MRKLPKFDCKNIREDTEWLGYLQLLSLQEHRRFSKPVKGLEWGLWGSQGKPRDRDGP